MYYFYRLFFKSVQKAKGRFAETKAENGFLCPACGCISNGGRGRIETFAQSAFDMLSCVSFRTPENYSNVNFRKTEL
jgi:hypothetical protein